MAGPIARAQRRLRRAAARLRVRLARGGLEARSPHFFRLVPGNARIERIASGFGFTEGPVWCEADRCLLFSDIPNDRILRLDPGGRCTPYREPSGNANGLALDREGRLVACEHRHRRVTRTEPGGGITVLADRFEGARLNSPNDVVVRRDGSVYFTDPTAGLRDAEPDLPFRGVYRLDPATGDLRVVADDFQVPNGLSFSPDEGRLYVDDSARERHHVRVFDVTPGGDLSAGRIFASMPPGRPGPPDGMKVDEQGHVYCTGPRGIWVFTPEGEHLGTIVPPEPPANCAFGDADRRTLYITARTSVYRMRVACPGIALPPRKAVEGPGASVPDPPDPTRARGGGEPGARGEGSERGAAAPTRRRPRRAGHGGEASGREAYLVRVPMSPSMPGATPTRQP